MSRFTGVEYTNMSPSFRKLLVLLAAGTATSGAVVGHDYWFARSGATAASDSPASSPASPNGNPRQHAASNLAFLPPRPAADESPSLRTWLDQRLATNPDLRALRIELEEALARLPAEDTAADAENETAAFEAIERARETAGTDYRSLMDLVGSFLERYPRGAFLEQARSLYAKTAQLWDRHDFEQACEFSANHPTDFAGRVARYEEYAERHAAAGNFVAESRKSVEQIRAEWDAHDYRVVSEALQLHPEDAAAMAGRVRRYLDVHPQGRHRQHAERFLALFERADTPHDYTVRVKAGSFDHGIARTFSFGPDLAVELEVAGVRIGRTPIVANSYEPKWDYEFPHKVRWRMGDPIRIRVIDFDYRNRTVLLIEPAKDDPLAMRFLSGPITVDGHRLVFESDFQTPTLPPP